MRVFRKSMRDNRRAWIGWTVALTAVAAMYASFYPSINTPAMADALNAFPQSLKEAFHMQDYTKPENYFAVSVFGLLVPILVAVFAIVAGVKAVAGDEEAGTLDLVQAQPVSRVSFAALAYGVGAWTGRRVYAIVVGTTVAVLGYLGDSFFTQINSLKWTEKFSPFNWYLGGEPLKHGVQWGHAGLLLGFAALFVAAGTWRYNRRDIAV